MKFLSCDGKDVIVTRLEIEKNSKSPFDDFQRKNDCQVKKCSHQVVQ